MVISSEAFCSSFSLFYMFLISVTHLFLHVLHWVAHCFGRCSKTTLLTWNHEKSNWFATFSENPKPPALVECLSSWISDLSCSNSFTLHRHAPSACIFCGQRAPEVKDRAVREDEGGDRPLDFVANFALQSTHFGMMIYACSTRYYTQSHLALCHHVWRQKKKKKNQGQDVRVWVIVWIMWSMFDTSESLKFRGQ